MSREREKEKVEDPQYEDRKRKMSLHNEDKEDCGNSRSYRSGKRRKKERNISSSSSSKHHKKKHKKKRHKKKDNKKSKERTVSGVCMYATSVWCTVSVVIYTSLTQRKEEMRYIFLIMHAPCLALLALPRLRIPKIAHMNLSPNLLIDDACSDIAENRLITNDFFHLLFFSLLEV